jgi:hypothetical protein
MDTVVTLSTPVTKSTTIQYTTFKIKDVCITLNTSATFVVLLYGPNSGEILCKKILMEGQDYTSWGTDDTYAINFVQTKIGELVL